MAMEEHFDYFRPEGHPMGANLNGYYPMTDFTSNKNQSGTKLVICKMRLISV